MKQLIRGSLAVSVGLSLLGCRTPEPAPVAKAPTAPTEHWVQSDELLALMRRLDVDTSAHWPSGLPDDPETPFTPREREDAFRSGAELATALSASARRIPDTVRDRNLSEADRAAFIGAAQVLSEQARKLGEAARHQRVEEMQRLLDATRATCLSCHTRFKDISGDLPPRT